MVPALLGFSSLCKADIYNSSPKMSFHQQIQKVQRPAGMPPSLVPFGQTLSSALRNFGLVQEQVAKKMALDRDILLAAIDSVRGAVMLAFPHGLPPWDRVRQALEGTEQLAGTSVSA